MVMGTKGLPVGAVPEQAIITLMRGDVVHMRCGCAAHDAMGMGKQIASAALPPAAVIATLAGRRAAAIMASRAGAVAGNLASATLTGWDDAATTTKAGWCERHG